MLHAWNRKCTCVSPVQTCISWLESQLVRKVDSLCCFANSNFCGGRIWMSSFPESCLQPFATVSLFFLLVLSPMWLMTCRRLKTGMKHFDSCYLHSWYIWAWLWVAVCRSHRVSPHSKLKEKSRSRRECTTFVSIVSMWWAIWPSLVSSMIVVSRSRKELLKMRQLWHWWATTRSKLCSLQTWSMSYGHKQ